ncbi:DUF4760 domain-containing protein [Brevundimonas aveniformis]|uniref:DUF4760 domain-containing protein n=1 Tax=Brevundimonas aveniformis TaxID=370977 RepID=UPI000A014FCF
MDIYLPFELLGLLLSILSMASALVIGFSWYRRQDDRWQFQVLLSLRDSMALPSWFFENIDTVRISSIMFPPSSDVTEIDGKKKVELLSFMNTMEAISLGINSGTLSERLWHRYNRSFFIKTFSRLSPLIYEIRNSYGNNRSYIEYETLVVRWSGEGGKK